MLRISAISSYVLILTCLFSCNTTTKKQTIESLFSESPGHTIESSIKYAKGFDIYEFDHVKKVVIYHPELMDNVIATFYISDSSAMERYGFQPSSNIIILPLTDVAVFSATQLNAFDKLKLLSKVRGISEAVYINNEEVKSRLVNGDIVELASTADYFIEKIVSENPSVIFYSPYKFTETNPLEVTEIPLVPFYDYFENQPLGRAEWIKFTGAFFGVDELASKLFREIESGYLLYKSLTDSLSSRPTVFSDKYFNGQWYVPGGGSYIASLFKDAGAEYLWKDDIHTASFPLDYELVFSKAYNADFWRIVGSYGDEGSYKTLAEENELYEHFNAFKEKQIIWCDAEATAYFEQSPLEPHILLADMIFAFHPQLLPDYQPKYYHILK